MIETFLGSENSWNTLEIDTQLKIRALRWNLWLIFSKQSSIWSVFNISFHKKVFFFDYPSVGGWKFWSSFFSIANCFQYRMTLRKQLNKDLEWHKKQREGNKTLMIETCRERFFYRVVKSELLQNIFTQLV